MSQVAVFEVLTFFTLVLFAYWCHLAIDFLKEWWDNLNELSNKGKGD